MGTLAAFQSVTTYLVDTYVQFAASAIAAVTILRSLMGFAFPLFAPYMYAKLEYGWGNTVLAIAAFVVGVPTPLLLWIFGERLRNASSMVSPKSPMLLATILTSISYRPESRKTGGAPVRPAGLDVQSAVSGADEKMKTPIVIPPAALTTASKR